ncbi:MAG: hypothetical protein ACHBN1_04790 [Heteroscytonema crispum UTEX LB 1556]
MGEAINRIQRLKEARKQLADIINNSKNVIIIHYSCESFYDRLDGSSPRITSIAVKNLYSGQTTSFSIHQVAEIKGYTKDEIEINYNSLEKLMLDDFYKYVTSHQHFTWVHWNMRDINYGFPAIAHRHKVLGGNPLEINEGNLVDLARLLISIYGTKYISHPRLQKLMERNKITDKDFLNGESEANAFKNKEYVKLHQSTLRKVDVIANITERLGNGILKTNAKWKDIYGSYPAALGEFLKEHWIVSLISFISAVVGLAVFFAPK